MVRTKITYAFLMALMAMLLTMQPVLASAGGAQAQQSQQHYGLTCSDGVCRAQLDLGVGTDWLPQGAWLTAMQSAVRLMPGGAGMTVRDEVTITLPTGNLTLADADLVMTVDEAGKIVTLRGSATAPVPTFGLLGDWQVVTPARLSIGYDLGSALQAYDAPLLADRRYFFVDVEAGLHLIAQDFVLTSDAGQRATLLVDFTQPLIFVDGRVTLHTDGQMAFIREALGSIGESGWLPADLPLRQSVLLHVQGQAGREVEPSLALTGEYRMAAGMVGKWFQLDAMPLLARGNATISQQGVMLEGTARSALQPERWFEGGAQAQLFVPFAAPDSASLTVGADVTLPAAGVDEATSATLAGEAGWMAATGEAMWTEAQQRWNQVGSAMHTAYESGSAWVGDGVGSGVAYTQQQWCGLTGWCAAEGAADQGTRVAAAE